jgi:hypothetical protein
LSILELRACAACATPGLAGIRRRNARGLSGFLSRTKSRIMAEPEQNWLLR